VNSNQSVHPSIEATVESRGDEWGQRESLTKRDEGDRKPGMIAPNGGDIDRKTKIDTETESQSANANAKRTMLRRLYSRDRSKEKGLTAT